MMRAAAAIGLVLCAAASAEEPPRGARAGEACTFRFSLGPIESGRARMAVGAPSVIGGRRLQTVNGQAETAKWLQLLLRIDDRYKLVFDAETFLPVEVESFEHGRRERHIKSKLQGRVAEVTVEEKGVVGHARRVVPKSVRDPLSALFALRAAPLRDGDKLPLEILDGVAQWRGDAVVEKRERIRLESDGEKPSRAAIRIHGELTRIDDLGRPMPLADDHGKIISPVEKRALTVWLSDDPTRLLLRAEGDTDFGMARLELTSAQTAP